ncbi:MULTISPECIES: LPS export ABC transporter permease LptG [Pseudovibrio]|uniref:LPS export ABC transporter permease LptG n=1 Tax=Stappiaceae TaxID=2821832 RepID=UPI0023663A7A|nr:MULTISPECIES: LPS export ABC transporter permease LptG [Pseudovibrio]MDD7908903.1 LPS export ABC transporter permease LptG [Pseudovibrio exalbescens]MDX5593776.1 LPS export ABC transporter permease LptG [Pseudovibrio sp. SPO723]
MMAGKTLSVYISLRFFKSIIGLFLFSAVLIFLFDVLELVRRGSDDDAFSLMRVTAISALRVPLILEQVLPFAVLFGSIWAFLSLSRSLELVVARAAGISVWQFTMPAILTGIFLGVFAICVYNPAAVKLQEMSDELAAGLFGVEQTYLIQTTGEVWLRQDGADGESVVHARHIMDRGGRLNGVTIFAFDRDGEFAERIEASTAILANNMWRLSDVTVFRVDSDPQIYGSYTLSTYLTPTEVRESIASPESISFWNLPRFIELSQRAGLPAYRYALQYQSLLAKPVLLVAMILIAAAVSLRVSRFGGIGRLIVGGIVAGFVLYVVSELSRDLGGAGIVPTEVAAWAPGVFGVLMGFTILLNQEDG